jgi:hypothetical protein
MTPQFLVSATLAGCWLVLAGYFAFAYAGPRLIGGWLDTYWIVPAACLLAAWNAYRAYGNWRSPHVEKPDGRSG